MTTEYLGVVPFSTALERQRAVVEQMRERFCAGAILGFEAERVVTLGVRGQAQVDLLVSEDELRQRGFCLERLDRGGQATLHNPGQLVIFPLLPLRRAALRIWVAGIAEVTQVTLKHWNISTIWREEQPGLFTAKGKIMACGFKIRDGISTHGLAINVCNNLADFALIRSCGLMSAPVDRMGREVLPFEVFELWVKNFTLWWAQNGEPALSELTR